MTPSPPLEPGNFLRQTGGWADNAAGWRGYRDHLGQMAGEEARLGRKALGRLSSGWAIGSPAFRRRLNEELTTQSATPDRFELLGADREAHAAARADLWEERLQKLAANFAIDLSGLPAQKSAPEKLQLASALRQITSVSNRWLAQRLQMGAPTGVSSFLYRFQASGGTRTRTFRAAVEPFAN